MAAMLSSIRNTDYDPTSSHDQQGVTMEFVGEVTKGDGSDPVPVHITGSYGRVTMLVNSLVTKMEVGDALTLNRTE